MTLLRGDVQIGVTMKGLRRRRPREDLKIRDPNPPERRLQLDVCLREYDALRQEIAGILVEIEHTYQWVLAVAVALLGSQLLSHRWTAFEQALRDQQWVLIAIALVTLWFPAYYISRWYDLRLAGVYVSTILYPKIRGLVSALDDDSILCWEDWRSRELARDWWGMMPAWSIRMSAPFFPTVTAAALFWRAALISGGGWDGIERTQFGIWISATGWLLLAWRWKVGGRPEQHDELRCSGGLELPDLGDEEGVLPRQVSQS